MGVTQVETTFAEDSVVCKRLKIKIFAKKPLTSQRDETNGVPVGNCPEKSSLADWHIVTASNTKLSCSIVGSKRKLDGGAVEFEKEKKVKMDRSGISKCRHILMKLMKHRDGYLFNEPVDPDKLGIPDYFDIIERPMDLGTIKRQMDQNNYKYVEEFESDVRLTFSNAIQYNPPGNWVHLAAKRMMEIFLKLVKEKMHRQPESIELPSFGKKVHTFAHNRSKECGKKLSSPAIKLLGEAKVPKELGSKSSKSFMSGSEPDGLIPSSCQESAPSRLTHHQALHVSPEKSVGKVKLENAATPVKKVPHDVAKAVNVEHVKTPQLSMPDPDSDGSESCVDEEHACTTSFASTIEGLETELDIRLSPTRALRAAMLKSRFADTILKAQHKTLLQPGDHSDHVKLQQEKERLERRQHEEKARIEAQIRAAESAARFKAESELKKQREQQREAARLALDQMEQSVDLDDNFHTLRELEPLIGSSPLFFIHQSRDGRCFTLFDGFDKSRLRRPLEELGLSIKAEYMLCDDDDDTLMQDREDGEVLF